MLIVNLLLDRPPNVAGPNKGKRVFQTAKLKQQTWQTKHTHEPRAFYFPIIPIQLTGFTQGVEVSKFIPATLLWFSIIRYDMEL